MSVAASMVVVRTDRGDDMFMTQLERSAQQVHRPRRLTLLPRRARAHAGARPGRPTRAPRPGAGALERELVLRRGRDDASLGVYAASAGFPTRRACTRGDRRAGQAGDHRPRRRGAAPPADDDAQTIERDSFDAAALRRAVAALSGDAGRDRAGARRSLGAAARRGRTPVDVALDLTWETAGEPYQWRVATRYEIPCRVTGTVRIGDEEHALVRSGPARPLVGDPRLVGERLDVERAAPRGRHPRPRRHGPELPGLRRRLRPARRRARRGRRRRADRDGRQRRPDLRRPDRAAGPNSRRRSSRSRSARCDLRRPTAASRTSPARCAGSRPPTGARARLDRVEPEPNRRSEAGLGDHLRAADPRADGSAGAG